MSFGSTTISFTGVSGKLPVILVHAPPLLVVLKTWPKLSQPEQEENPEKLAKAVVESVGLAMT